MTISETQRRTLDLMAESIGWHWSDVETLSGILYDECVAGLSRQQAVGLMAALPKRIYQSESGTIHVESWEEWVDAGA